MFLQNKKKAKEKKSICVFISFIMLLFGLDNFKQTCINDNFLWLKIDINHWIKQKMNYIWRRGTNTEDNITNVTKKWRMGYEYTIIVFCWDQYEFLWTLKTIFTEALAYSPKPLGWGEYGFLRFIKTRIDGRLYLYNRCLFMKYIVTFIIKSNVSAK